MRGMCLPCPKAIAAARSLLLAGATAASLATRPYTTMGDAIDLDELAHAAEASARLTGGAAASERISLDCRPATATGSLQAAAAAVPTGALLGLHPHTLLVSHSDRAPTSTAVAWTRWHALHAQQLRLEQFTRFHAQAVARTQEDARLLARAHAQLAVRESPLAAGLLGVFAVSDLPLSFRCPYPGILMAPRLHDDLHARYHVPTAVQLSDERVLVGDPCALACVVNGAVQELDDSYRRAPGMSKSACPSQRRHRRSRGCSANIAFAWEEMDAVATITLCIRPTRPIAAGEELLLDYGRSFWRRQRHALPPYFQVCCSRDCSVLNPLFLCDGKQKDGRSCGIGQHELCFARASDLPMHGSPTSNWYCNEHAGQPSC